MHHYSKSRQPVFAQTSPLVGWFLPSLYESSLRKLLWYANSFIICSFIYFVTPVSTGLWLCTLFPKLAWNL